MKSKADSIAGSRARNHMDRSPNLSGLNCPTCKAHIATVQKSFGIATARIKAAAKANKHIEGVYHGTDTLQGIQGSFL